MPTLTGTVADGYGNATRDVTAGVYARLGDLTPGTLNVELAETPELTSPTTTFRHGAIDRHIWPATVGGYPCWLLHADHLGPVVELLADVHLRTVLDLCTGDPIDVEVEQ